ncbi:uncharacterized protein LOC107309044 isoform X2 [Coturnix japonica]|uniref:uncharacterized protein LOC107309044 isoform X2 n=1 Tax=Coturnix japonica TaxID=93934 RepID=UPI0013A5D724|nr:uncharacterized protein LOC107309044 isoform X2 [Coturnix japonica]XP_032299007.1 uncharacterized protein LOC107309044 isoform X2 [Coturnix japonica]XP_032299009.1 uncharacterized protein LOC107309044 isoform X2 [Coturnix japonica]
MSKRPTRVRARSAVRSQTLKPADRPRAALTGGSPFGAGNHSLFCDILEGRKNPMLTMASGNKRCESKRCSQTEMIIHKRRSEDLLTFYLRHQDALSSPCACHQSNVFTLPCSDAMRRDIQVLQKFIKKYEPRGAVVTKEEVVIISADNDVCKQTSPKNLTKAATLLEGHRVETESKGCLEAQSTDLGEPPGGRTRSQPPAPRDQREPKDLGLPPDDFSKKVYRLAATYVAVAVGFLCWSRLRLQLGNYYWLSLTFVMYIALILLSSATSHMGSVSALTVTAIGSTILGIISDSYESLTVTLVGGITAAATLLLCLFALKTNKPLTNLTISSTLSVLWAAGAIACVVINSYKFQALYALFGILFFATDLTRTVTELQSQPMAMQRSMDHAEAAQGLFIPIAMIFFFTLLLVG